MGNACTADFELYARVLTAQTPNCHTIWITQYVQPWDIHLLQSDDSVIRPCLCSASVTMHPSMKKFLDLARYVSYAQTCLASSVGLNLYIQFIYLVIKNCITVSLLATPWDQHVIYKRFSQISKWSTPQVQKGSNTNYTCIIVTVNVAHCKL